MNKINWSKIVKKSVVALSSFFVVELFSLPVQATTITKYLSWTGPDIFIPNLGDVSITAEGFFTYDSSSANDDLITGRGAETNSEFNLTGTNELTSFYLGIFLGNQLINSSIDNYNYFDFFNFNFVPSTNTVLQTDSYFTSDGFVLFEFVDIDTDTNFDFFFSSCNSFDDECDFLDPGNTERVLSVYIDEATAQNFGLTGGEGFYFVSSENNLIATSVPEPSNFIAVGLLCGGLILKGRKKR